MEKLSELLERGTEVQVCMTPKFSSIPTNQEAYLSFELSSLMIYEKLPIKNERVESNDFDAKKVYLAPPKLKDKTFVGYKNGDSSSRFEIHASNLVTKFDFSDYQGDGNFSLVLMDNRDTEDNKKFFESLFVLDEKMIDFGIEHSEKIFGKVFTEAQRNSVKEIQWLCKRKY